MKGSRAPAKVAHDNHKQVVLNVRIGRIILTLVAGVALMATIAQAQGTAQPAGGTAGQAAPQSQSAAQRRAVPVAVIDMRYILNNHPTMKQEIERIKARQESATSEFEKKRQAILKMMEELKEQFTEGTPDYQRKEQEIAEQDTQFRLDVVRKNKELEDARAQVFFQVHQQVSQLVKFYCENSGTFVVLQVAREKPDPKKPETIEMAMRQEVFYYQEAIDVDITEWVLGYLKSQAAQVNQATRPGGAVTK